MFGFVEITTADGQVSLLPVEKSEIKIGRNPDAEICLAQEKGIEWEHILLAPRKEQCFVSVAQGAREVFVNGAPIASGMFPWGTRLEVGGLKLVLLKDDPSKTKKATTQISPVSVLGLIGIAAGLYMIFRESPLSLQIETTAPEIPALFPDEAPVCAFRGAPEVVLSQAVRLGAQAFAKSERYPFDASDGVESVQLFQQTVACLQGLSGTDAGHADITAVLSRMQAEAGYMRQRIDNDYLGHRFRLDRALQQGRHRDALHESRALLALTAGVSEQHPYRQWLVRNERQLELAQQGEEQ